MLNSLNILIHIKMITHDLILLLFNTKKKNTLANLKSRKNTEHSSNFFVVILRNDYFCLTWNFFLQSIDTISLDEFNRENPPKKNDNFFLFFFKCKREREKEKKCAYFIACERSNGVSQNTTHTEQFSSGRALKKSIHT